MTFSWEKAKKDAIIHACHSAKIMLKTNKAYKVKHPGEARDANDGKYTLLTKRVTEEVLKYQKEFTDRVEKRKEQ